MIYDFNAVKQSIRMNFDRELNLIFARASEQMINWFLPYLLCIIYYVKRPNISHSFYPNR